MNISEVSFAANVSETATVGNVKIPPATASERRVVTPDVAPLNPAPIIGPNFAVTIPVTFKLLVVVIPVTVTFANVANPTYKPPRNVEIPR